MPRHPGLEALREMSTTRRQLGANHSAHAAAEKNQIVEALQLGARGVVMKDSATQLLLKSIDTVMAGEYWVGRESVSNLVQYLRNLVQSSGEEARQRKFGLTPRELEIVSAVVAGYANKEIAEYFKISEDTVKHHLEQHFRQAGGIHAVGVGSVRGKPIPAPEDDYLRHRGISAFVLGNATCGPLESLCYRIIVTWYEQYPRIVRVLSLWDCIASCPGASRRETREKVFPATLVR